MDWCSLHSYLFIYFTTTCLFFPWNALSFPNNLGFWISSDLFWLNNKSSKFPFHVVMVAPPLLGIWWIEYRVSKAAVLILSSPTFRSLCTDLQILSVNCWHQNVTAMWSYKIVRIILSKSDQKLFKTFIQNIDVNCCIGKIIYLQCNCFGFSHLSFLSSSTEFKK